MGWFWKPTPPKPETPPSVARAIAIVVCNAQGQRVAGASVRMQTSPTVWHTGTTGEDGVLTWNLIPASLRDTQLAVSADGYVPFDDHIVLTPNINQQVWLGPGSQQATSLNLPPLQSAHVDPSVFSLEELAQVRGGMWVNRAAIPWGPRPGQPDNINAMDYYEWYGPDDRATMLVNYLRQGYTHAVTGPVIDPDGYHGKYPTYPGPLTQTWWDTYLDAMQEWWDAGIVPVHFAIPDFPGWNVDRAIAELGPFFAQPRAQKLLRFIVTAWEPSPWTNAEHVKAARWLRGLFPNALIAVHLEPDHNAPGLSSEIANGSLTEAQMWANVAPYIHLFLQQTKAPFAGSQADKDDWLRMWDRAYQGSWDSRFLDGYHGWPTFSAWGTHGILALPSEYFSYACFWGNAPESEAQTWGDAARRAGARGYLDGGTVSVP